MKIEGGGGQYGALPRDVVDRQNRVQRKMSTWDLWRFPCVHVTLTPLTFSRADHLVLLFDQHLIADGAPPLRLCSGVSTSKRVNMHSPLSLSSVWLRAALDEG